MKIAWIACSLALLANCSSSAKPAPTEPSPESVPLPHLSASDFSTPDSEPTAAPAPFSPGSLPEWPSLGKAEADSSIIEVHAADVPADALFRLLYDGEAPVLRISQTEAISGRIRASRTQAVHALLKSHPALAPGPLATTTRKRGRKVEVAFYEATTANLMRLLSSVGGVNIIVPASANAKFTIFAKDMPWDQLLELLAAELGMVLHAAEKHTFLLADKDYKLDKKLLKKGKGWLEINASDVSASLLASTVADVTGLDYTVPCDAKAVTLRLRRSKAGTAMAAIAHLSGTTLSKGKTRCPNPPALLTRALKKDDRLLGTFYTGNRRRILIQSSAGDVFYSEDAKAIRINPSFVSQGDVVLPPEEELELKSPNLAGARLTATVVDGKRSAIVVERKDGSLDLIYTITSPELEVSPGKATFRQPDGSVTTLLLLPESR